MVDAETQYIYFQLEFNEKFWPVIFLIKIFVLNLLIADDHPNDF